MTNTYEETRSKNKIICEAYIKIKKYVCTIFLPPFLPDKKAPLLNYLTFMC